jgi:hypothetical protein
LPSPAGSGKPWSSSALTFGVDADPNFGPVECLPPDGDELPDDEVEVVLEPESVDGAAVATAVPRLIAPKPREPVMAAEAASFLMVLSVVMEKRYGPGAGPGVGRKMRLDQPTWCK